MSLHEELLEKLPNGWKFAYYSGAVIAIHPDHVPRVILIGQASATPFDYWEELAFIRTEEEDERQPA